MPLSPHHEEPGDRRRLHELLSAMSDGPLDTEKSEELRQLLANEEAQQYYVEFAMLDACLDLAGSERIARQAPLLPQPEKSAPNPVSSQRRAVRAPLLGFLHAAIRAGGKTPLMRAVMGAALLLIVGAVVLVAIHLSRHGDRREIAQAERPSSRLPEAPAGEHDSLAAPRSFPQEMQNSAEETMLDPATDRPDKPWCYLAKSTTVIGVPEQPEVTQVTFDGALFTRYAELCFFYGGKDRPLLARQKNWLEGWIPLVQYSWRDGEIAYDIEMFAARLEGENADNTVNFVQLRMRNISKRSATGRFAAALRHNGGDYRLGRSDFSPNWRYEMTGDGVVRDGKLAYTFSPAAIREATPAQPYDKPFVGSQKYITPRAECCLARYRKELQPGETFAATFKMPRVPVSTAAFNAKVLAADYQKYREGTIAYWRKLFDGGETLAFPERHVQEAERASLVHVLLATRKHSPLGPDKSIGWMQTDGLPYADFFITSMPEMVLAYLQSGQFDRAKGLVLHSLGRQKPSGLFLDVALSQGAEVPAGHGHGMHSAAMTILYSQDKSFAERVYPNLQKAVQYIADSIAKDEYGLLPPTYPYDSEMIKGHYTSNNLWALLGLRNAIRVARFLGKADDVAAWSELEQRYFANIVKGVARLGQSRRLRAAGALQVSHRPGRPPRLRRMADQPGLGEHAAGVSRRACLRPPTRASAARWTTSARTTPRA